MKRIILPLIVFEATTACNQKCMHCYNVWKMPGSSASKAAGFRGAVRTLRALFRQAQVGRIAMSGGEPMLAERIAELVLMCRMRHSAVSLITNGNAGSDEDFASLQRLGVDVFEIPINCDRNEVHDVMAGQDGSWLRANRTLRMLLDMGARVICVVVLTRLNAARIVPTLEHLASVGVRQVMLNRFNLGGAGISNRNDLLLCAEELRAAYRAADEAATDLSLSLSANVGTPWCVVDPRDYHRVAMSSCGRDPAHMPLTLGADGDLRLCNHSPMVLGNIHNDRIEKLLKKSVVSDFFAARPGICASCELYWDCQGGCKAVSQQLSVSMECHDPVGNSVRVESLEAGGQHD